jgi:integrase
MSDRVPSYRHHKQSGQAVVTLPDGLGSRRDVLLGKYRSKESRLEYARVIAELEAAGRSLPPEQAAGLSVNELLIRFWAWAEKHYRKPDGTSTGELKEYQLTLRPLRKLYGLTLAAEFGPLALKALRGEMICQPVTRKFKVRDRQTGKLAWKEKVIGTGLCRGVINQRIGRIKRVFKWGVSEQLIPETTYRALLTVEGLHRGRSDARETKPVLPVPVAFVEDTLPHLMPTVADMVLLQLHSGMRPGEVCAMRGIDLDMTGKVWMYRPGSDQGPAGAHKTAHRGHRKVVALGPKAQEIIRRHLKADVAAYLFSPADAMREKWERDRRERKTKIYPCEVKRLAKRKPKTKRRYTDRYAVTSYTIAIRRACLKAGVPHWHPHQLRHSKATEIRKEFGLDAARAVLGHRSPAITEVYAELDAGKAAEVMERLG